MLAMHGAFAGSAAADGGNDFQAVSGVEKGFCILAFRNNFAISFDDDALAGIPKLH